MKLSLMGRLFPALFGKVVYDYTAAALPARTPVAGGGCCDFHVVKP